MHFQFFPYSNYDFSFIYHFLVARVARPEKLKPIQTANSRTQSSCSNTSFSDKLEMRVITAPKNEGKIEANGDFCYKKMVDEICTLTEKV